LKQIQFKKIPASLILIPEGTAIVLLHGFLEKKACGIITLLLSKKTEYIDLLGHGETECLGYVHSMEDNADAVHVLSELRIRKASLVIRWVVMSLWLSPNCILNM
jgi:hypothetical protein